MKKNLKIYLYTNNHNKISGIIDYIEYFKTLSRKFNFKLITGKNLPYKKKYDFVIFIEEFSKITEFLKIFFFLKINPTKKILVLTEFFNENKNTLNNFNYSKKNLFFFSNNFIYTLFSPLKKFLGYLALGFSKLIFLIDFIFRFLILRISKIMEFTLYTILKNINFYVKGTNILFKIKHNISKYEFIKKFFSILRGYILLFNSGIKKLKYVSYYKLRFFSLVLLIDYFDICVRSHSDINYKKKKFLDILFLFKKNLKIYKNKKFAFEFSGELNYYRKNFLKKILINEKMYSNIDLSNIKETLRLPLGFYTFNLNNKNYLSLHPKKSNSWPYCSPTRYINSINKNYIPVVVDNFKDKVSAYLTIHISELQGRKENFLYNLEKKINKNFKNYKLLADKAASQIYNNMIKIVR